MRNMLNVLMQAAGSEGSEATITDLTEVQEALAADAPDATDESKQERKARLMAAEAQAKKQATDGTALPDELVGLAQREITECWKEFSSRGGVWDLRQAVKGKLRNISQHILNIAKECARAAYGRCEGDPNADYVKLAGSMFRNAMAQAELSLRTKIDLGNDDEEAKLDSFLSGSWNVYKSHIKTGMDAGFDPRDYDSIYQLTEARKAAKAAKNGGGEGKGRAEGETTTPEANADAEGSDEGGEETMEDGDWNSIADYVVDPKHAKVHAALVLFLGIVGDADADKHADKIAAILNVSAKEIAKLSRQENGNTSQTLDTSDSEQNAVQA